MPLPHAERTQGPPQEQGQHNQMLPGDGEDVNHAGPDVFHPVGRCQRRAFAQQQRLRQQELHAHAVLTDLTQFCARLRRRLPAVTLAEKQALLQLLIDRIIVGTDTVEIQHVIPLHTDPTPVLKSASGTKTAFRRLRSDGTSEAGICGVERTPGRNRADGPGVLIGREATLLVVVSRAGWHVGGSRLSSGAAATDGTREYAPTGRGGRRGHESARHVSQSAQTGSRVVDIGVGDGSGTHE